MDVDAGKDCEVAQARTRRTTLHTDEPMGDAHVARLMANQPQPATTTGQGAHGFRSLFVLLRS